MPVYRVELHPLVHLETFLCRVALTREIQPLYILPLYRSNQPPHGVSSPIWEVLQLLPVGSRYLRAVMQE